MKNEQAENTSSGVEDLIAKLKEQGIASGQEKAENIVLDAQKRAEWIINEASREAQQLIDAAKAEAEAVKIAGEDALKLAARDAFLTLKDMLSGRFIREVKRVVGNKMTDEKFLGELILALAGQVRDKTALDLAQHILIQLPERQVGVAELRSNTEELQEGALSRYVIDLATNMLHSGVELDGSGRHKSGLLLKLLDEEIVIDFTDDAVAKLLLEHLQPRFQALMEGIVK
jgi:V/A-type H+-transporting ATPase subunit E